MRRRGLVVVPDVEKTGIPGGAGLESLKAKAFMGVALSSGDAGQEPLGVLYVDYDAPRTFNFAQQKLIQAFAEQAAIAIQTARLVEDQRRQLDSLAALHEFVGQAAKLTEEHELFDRIVASVCDTVKAASATLLTRPDGAGVQQVAHCGGKGKFVNQQAARPGCGLIGEAIESGAVPLLDGAPTHSVAMLPIWVERQVWGLVVAEREEDAPFDVRDTILLQTMAIQAGVALAQQRRQRRRADAIASRVNPYQVGGAVTQPDAFYGRQELIEDILSGVERNHYLVYGERRIGKTSLLHQLDIRLTKMSEEGRGACFYPVYISLQGVSEAAFFARLRKGILDRTRVPFPPPRRGSYGADKFRDDFPQILEALRAQTPGRISRVILLLDEMDTFVHYDSRLHERFRSLFAEADFNALKLIMAGVSIREVNTVTSPWYNLFQQKHVAELTKDAARQLIEGPVRAEYMYQPKARDLIIKWSDHKPLVIQALCYGSVQAMHERVARDRAVSEMPDVADVGVITVADAEHAIEVEYAKRREEYDLLWQKLTDEQHAAIYHTLGSANKTPLALEDPRLVPASLFSQPELHPITRSTTAGRRLTQMFMRWLRDRQV